MTEMFDMFSFFGMEDASKKEEVNEKEGSEIKDVTVQEFSTLPNEEDDDDAVEFTEEVVKETKPATSSPAKKEKKSSLTGKSKVSLPLTVYGRNFTHEITELEDKTYDGVVKALYQAGYKTVALNDTEFIPGEGTLFIKEPTTGTADNTQVIFPSTNGVIVCDGLLQAEITSGLINKEVDEISVEDLTEKWVELNPQYKGVELSYSARAAVATPVFEKCKELKVKIPCTVNIFGNKFDVSTEDFSSTNEVTADEIVKQYVPISIPKGMTFAFSKLGEEYVILPQRGNAKTVLIRADLDVLKDAKTITVEEKYLLPLCLVATSSDQRVTVTEEMFGKSKITQKDVLQFLSENHSNYNPQLIGFKIYKATDRQFNFVYGSADENRKLVVSATSGKKG